MNIPKRYRTLSKFFGAGTKHEHAAYLKQTTTMFPRGCGLKEKQLSYLQE